MEQGASATSITRWQKKIAKKFEPLPRYLIPVLQYVQSEEGYLPSEAMSAAAKHLGVSESKVFGVASFYSLFHFEPRGRHTITVCRGTACHVRGSAKLLSDLERTLGIEAGGTTEDLAFSLETVACYGSCALAPVVVVNDVVHRQQTAATLTDLLEEVREQSGGESKKAGGKKKGTTGRKRSRKKT